MAMQTLPTSAGAWPVRHRLFFALKPGPLLARQIGVYAAEESGGLRPLQWRRLHITLAIVGDSPNFPRSSAEALMRVGGLVAEQVAPIDVMLDHISGGQRSVALRHRRTAAMVELADLLASAMAAEGLGLREGWSFNPHMTLWYGNSAPVSRPSPRFEWRADRLILIHSLVGLTRHESLGEWSLAGATRQGELFA